MRIDAHESIFLCALKEEVNSGREVILLFDFLQTGPRIGGHFFAA